MAQDEVAELYEVSVDKWNINPSETYHVTVVQKPDPDEKQVGLKAALPKVWNGYTDADGNVLRSKPSGLIIDPQDFKEEIEKAIADYISDNK